MRSLGCRWPARRSCRPLTVELNSLAAADSTSTQFPLFTKGHFRDFPPNLLKFTLSGKLVCYGSLLHSDGKYGLSKRFFFSHTATALPTLRVILREVMTGSNPLTRCGRLLLPQTTMLLGKHLFTTTWSWGLHTFNFSFFYLFFFAFDH